MAVDGKWEIVINSPLGAQKAALDIATNGSALTGTQQRARARPAGKRQGGRQHCQLVGQDHHPMPLTLDFTGTVDGDKLSGSVKAAPSVPSPSRATATA
jgi:hypothetical protein